MPNESVLITGQADDGQRVAGHLPRTPSVQAAQEVQVLQRVQIGLQCGQVAEVGDVTRALGIAGRPAIDLHLPGTRPGQARQHAQQGGFAGAIAALHQQGFAGVHMEVQRAEHRLVIAGKAQAAGGQQCRGVQGAKVFMPECGGNCSGEFTG